MFNKSFVAMLLLSPAIAFAQAAPSRNGSSPAAAGPLAAAHDGRASSSGSAIDCTRWYKLPNGDWRPAAGTVINFEGESVAITHTVAGGDFTIKGQDVYTLVDQTCGE